MLYSDSQAVIGVLKKGGSFTAFLPNSWMMTISNPGKKSMDISSSLNCFADVLSREGPIQTDWILNRNTFLWIQSGFSGVQIDMFAKPQNAQLTKFANARPSGTSVQCPIVSLESMGTDLSFSTSEPLAQSADETKGFQRNGNTDSPRMADSKWVPLLNSMSKKIYLPDCSLYQTSSNQNFYAKSYLTRHLCA